MTTDRLTEFLTARIDEDERAVGHSRRPAAARVLADVAAKRQLVRLLGRSAIGNVVLRVLAGVYADHPDYDARWDVIG